MLHATTWSKTRISAHKRTLEISNIRIKITTQVRIDSIGMSKKTLGFHSGKPTSKSLEMD